MFYIIHLFALVTASYSLTSLADEDVILRGQIGLDVCDLGPGTLITCYQKDGKEEVLEIHLKPQGANSKSYFGSGSLSHIFSSRTYSAQIEIRKFENGRYSVYAFMTSPIPDDDGSRERGGGTIKLSAMDELPETEFESHKLFLPGQQVWMKLRIKK